MNDYFKKEIEELVKKQTVGEDIYSQLIKQKLLYDYSLN